MSAEAANTNITTFNKGLTAMRPEFSKALPPQITPEKFERVCATAIAMNPRLLETDRRSLYGAMTKCAQDGLLPDGREAALVVYGKETAYLPMVAGIMKKVRNSGEIGNWSVHVVREHDDFDYELGDEERIVHKPARKDRGEVIGAYSIVALKNGEKSREYMDVAEIESVRTRSRAKDSGPWKTDYAEMCKKTVIRRHSKRLPMSTDLDQVIRRDDEYVDLDPTPTVIQHEAPTRPTRLASIVAPVAEPEPLFDDEPPPDESGL